MNMTFIEMIISLLADNSVRRQDWTPDTNHFIKVFVLPASYNRSGIVIEYKNGITSPYFFDSEDIVHDKWKVVT
jgi:hypothetical protein